VATASLCVSSLACHQSLKAVYTRYRTVDQVREVAALLDVMYVTQIAGRGVHERLARNYRQQLHMLRICGCHTRLICQLHVTLGLGWRKFLSGVTNSHAHFKVSD